jgi:ubiquitin-like protein Pup
MKQAQTQKVKTTSPSEQPIDERPELVRNEKLTDAIDEILDEIDEVLEENAEQFVTQYIQKGGQ